MNKIFQFDICALIVFLIILGTSYYKKLIKGKENRIFFTGAIFCSVTCVASIICSVLFQYCHYNIFTVILAYVFEYISLVLNTLIFPLAVVYILSQIGILNQYKKNHVLPVIFFSLFSIPFLFILDNVFSNNLFVITRSLFLNYGKNYKFLLASDGAFVLIQLGLVIVYRKFLPKSKIIIGCIMCPILLFFIIVEFRYPYNNFILFVFSIIAFLINTCSQRAELLINPAVGVWSDYSFYSECKKGYLLNRDATVIFMKVLNFKSLILFLGRDKYNFFVRQISSLLLTIFKSFIQEENLYYLGDFTFAVYLENISDEVLSLISGDIVTDLSRETDFNNLKILLNPLVCIVKLPKDINNYESLKYFSKSFNKTLSGKKGLVWLEDVVHSKEFKTKNEIEKILENGIKEKRFEVYYQPIYSLKENRFISAEALLRLKDPEYGYIPPSVFIPPAEDNGSVLQLGDFVLEEVCKFISTEEFKKLGLEYVEINLSLSQCTEVQLPEKILSKLEKYKIDSSKIRLEINETTVAANPTITKENVQTLTDKGVYFVLDNYGVGYSNIRNITQIPFSLIKLDKSFLKDLEQEKTLVVLQDVIRMLKTLKREVLIEGIENESAVKIFNQLDCDLIQGCEFIQGFYYSKPLPKSDFVKFIDSSNNPPETISF